MSQTNEPKCTGSSPQRRIPSRERGQVFVLSAVTMAFVLFGMVGFVVDTGRLYVSFQQLQASTDAAAMAGGLGLATNSSTAISEAQTYGSETGGNNIYGNLSGVTMATPKVACISALTIPCDGITSFNAIQVKQTVSVPMTFAKFFGANSISLTATGTASAKGSNPIPYNIAVVLDTTQSMGQSGSDSCTDPNPPGKSYTTRIDCALIGVKQLLLHTAPCAEDAGTCTGTAAGSVDMVSLFVFPNVQFSTVSRDYTGTCSTTPTSAADSYPTPSITSTTGYLPTSLEPTSGANKGIMPPTTPTYQITPFLGDWRVTDLSTTLNNSSELVVAIGQNGTCGGIQTPGGQGTFYAGAIYAAAASLVAQQAVTGRAGSQNALIILSDGEANASTSELATKELTGNNGIGTGLTVSNSTSTYPSTIDQCTQGVAAAHYATNTLGIKVFSVAYGSSTSTSDCSMDSGSSKITPCAAMTNMASSTLNFYSDTTAKGASSGCTSTVNPETGLANIFGAIAGTFTKARLIPNNVFPSS